MIPSGAVIPALLRAALKAIAGGAKTLYDSFTPRPWWYHGLHPNRTHFSPMVGLILLLSHLKIPTHLTGSETKPRVLVFSFY